MRLSGYIEKKKLQGGDLPTDLTVDRFIDTLFALKLLKV